jgi:hypothetical protein
VTQGTAILHLFPGVAQVNFFWVFWQDKFVYNLLKKCVKNSAFFFANFNQKTLQSTWKSRGVKECSKFAQKNT